MFLKGHEATCFYNQIYCMDCMELLAEIPDGAVSLILTDPPYGISYQNHFAKHPHPLLTGDTGIDYKQLARESYRILQHNAHAYFLPVLTVTQNTMLVCRKLDSRLKIVW